MFKLFLSLLLINNCLAMKHEFLEKTLNNINKWNFDVACWGKENAVKQGMFEKMVTKQCMAKGGALPVKDSPPIETKAFRRTLHGSPYAVQSLQHQMPGHSLYFMPQANHYHWPTKGWRNSLREKRGAEEFGRSYQELKQDHMEKIINLTCVLTTMGMLKPDGQVNLEVYTKLFWDSIDISITKARDPVWKEKIIAGWTNCYKIAQAWPEEALDTHLLGNMARPMVFFQCTMKVKKECCSAALMSDYLESFTTIHGKELPPTGSNMPGDKYDMAMLSTALLYKALSPVEQFVEEFFHGENNGQHSIVF